MSHKNTFVLLRDAKAPEYASVKEAFDAKKPEDKVWIKARGDNGFVGYYGPVLQP